MAWVKQYSFLRSSARHTAELVVTGLHENGTLGTIRKLKDLIEVNVEPVAGLESMCHFHHLLIGE